MTALEIMEAIKEMCETHECMECPFANRNNDCPFEYGFNYAPNHWEIKGRTIERVWID